MKYGNAFDIWQVPSYLRKDIHPGQWIYAGSRDNKGQYLGQTKSGVDIVVWKSKLGKRRQLREYARNHGG